MLSILVVVHIYNLAHLTRLDNAHELVRVEAGEPYTAYGFGDDEADAGAGVRRRLDGLSVDCVGLSCPDREVFETEWVGSDGVCSGDSGGPALDASGRVIGVVSRGYRGCRAPVYGSIPAFAAFLESEALRAAAEGGYEPPVWAGGRELPAAEEPSEGPGAPASSCALAGRAGTNAGALALALAWALAGGARRSARARRVALRRIALE